MAIWYYDVGHCEARSDLWAWATGLPTIWVATCLAPFETQGSLSHSEYLRGLDWHEGTGYCQGRVSHAKKVISVITTWATRRHLEHASKLLSRLYPGYDIKYFGQAEDLMKETEQQLVEAA